MAVLAVCGIANAQKLTYVPYNTSGAQNAFRMGTAVSPNGRWVAGDDGEKGFICDMTTGEVKDFASEFIGDEGVSNNKSVVNAVSNDGTGYGYMESDAAKFNFSTGTYDRLTNRIMGAVTAVNGDNTFAVGYTYNEDYSDRNAVYWENDEMKTLPQPTEAWLGFPTSGFQATAMNSDGSTIVGFATDDLSSYPLIVWHRNVDGSYSVNPVCKRYFNPDFEQWQKHDSFNADCISANGKWIAVNMHDVTDDWSDGGMYIARYDVEADTLGIIDCPEHSESIYYYANGIANDGTIVGSIENDDTGDRLGFIVEADESTAKYLSDVFPTVTEIAKMEELGKNYPCAITPDGRYIVGFGGVISPIDENAQWTAAWLLDTERITTDVEETVADNAPKKVLATYNAEGKKLNKSNIRRNSLVINRLEGGKTVKSIAK